MCRAGTRGLPTVDARRGSGKGRGRCVSGEGTGAKREGEGERGRLSSVRVGSMKPLSKAFTRKSCW